ncbi:helix-turn-helix transcriptional regulator [Nucisporomicrobium flavum]|uniref:helix-turn-helix transcriptional regulator n=1 Tax=Nucisporomicrobium flavum TaxID=2785915 RepID=UPI0018F6C116|nr:helix-turn-helix domain-containing protein [Nucisporomicrobium flavum]
MTEPWNAVATLADPSRRALYDYVRRQDHAVGREEAADATEMSRNLAAFHLDKLVEAGLLTARYEPPAGRPRGRGRAPKVYEPTGDGLTVTIPQRQYELLADVLAEALAAGESPGQVARERGRRFGQAMGGAGDVLGALAGLGFEPEADADAVRLHNCPFHAVAARHTELVCGLNLSFVTGLLDGLGQDAQARLAPRPGACCVEVTPAAQP